MLPEIKEMQKTVVAKTDSYTLSLDALEDLLFIHCDVHKWNKTTKKDLHKALDKLLDDFKQPFYASHEINDNKHRKFLEMYKFNYYSTEKCLDGLYRQVWIKEYK